MQAKTPLDPAKPQGKAATAAKSTAAGSPKPAAKRQPETRRLPEIPVTISTDETSFRAPLTRVEIDMILGRVRDEKDFSGRVYDIWIKSDSQKARDTGFNQLAARLKRSKTQYGKTKSLDEKLFGENFEL